MFLKVLQYSIIFAIISQINSCKNSEISESSEEVDCSDNELVDRDTEFQFSSIESDDDESELNSRYVIESDDEENDENIVTVEGDILMTKTQKENWVLRHRVDEDESESEEFQTTRNGIKDKEYRWIKDEDGNVYIPYEISKKSRFSNFFNKF